ncbi:MAG: peptidoglycan-binding protein, partial [Clostridia bacterium]|nr:peptidoglycan-binding protein [Clostridia bacterium]
MNRRLICLIMLMLLPLSALAQRYETLRYRDEGPAVLQMQQALNALGYNTKGADGKFGPGTEEAIRAFQRDQRLNVDGLAGHATLTRLYELAGVTQPQAPQATQRPSEAAEAASSTADYSTLRYKDSGNRVKKLQQALKDQGYYNGSVDGAFRSGTYNAVKAFQKANGLYVDGVAGPKTLKLLWNPKAASAPTAEPTAKPTVSPTSKPTASPTQPPASKPLAEDYSTLRYKDSGDRVKKLQ